MNDARAWGKENHGRNSRHLSNPLETTTGQCRMNGRASSLPAPGGPSSIRMGCSWKRLIPAPRTRSCCRSKAARSLLRARDALAQHLRDCSNCRERLRDLVKRQEVMDEELTFHAKLNKAKTAIVELRQGPPNTPTPSPPSAAPMADRHQLTSAGGEWTVAGEDWPAARLRLGPTHC